jgi:tripartite-type tricarboxylate transporter receptor subunit TctC
MRSALALALLCLSLGASAEAFPAKPVRLVVPFPPGGTADLLARTLGDQLGSYWGQPVVIENRPGAGSMLATQYVQRAPADGYTLLVMAPSFVVNPMLQPDARYDALKDFAPIALAVTSPLVLVVNPTLGARSLKELGDLSRASPGKFSYGTVGPATTQQMLGEVLKGDSKIDWIYAPYPGGAPAVTALLGNHVTAVIGNYSEVSQQLAAGKLRALAVGSPERLEALPDVPTIAELGYDPAMGTIWFGIVAPAGTPRGVIERLQTDIVRALEVPAVRERLAAQNLYPARVPAGQFADFLAIQVQKYSRIIKDAGIKTN